jgi:Mn2+/Fe2+ NRAMP family transporter
MSMDEARPDLERLRRGLRMAVPPDEALLAEERRELSRLEGAGFVERARGYLALIGPGYLQSAMTLGGGTAAASLFAGALFGYQLLWVAPVAMLLGVVMLAAVAHQTLSTGMRPMAAMTRFAGRPFAVAWALGALFSSIIWHFPQYSLASAVLVDLGDVAGVTGLAPMAASAGVLVWAIAISLLYGRSTRLVKAYERVLKYMVWAIVLAFGIVVAKTGVKDWGALARGFVAFELPGERNGVAATTLVIAGLSAAVGVNMLFLYPHSLLARGWGREHRRLARTDLIVGMFVPYALATTLMVVATANTIHLDPEFAARGLSPVEAARSLSEVIGVRTGRVVFGLGVLGMALSSITLHMLCAGFVATELFGWEVGSRRYTLATLLPTPGFLAPLYWSKIAVWVAVPTTILCGFFLPIAYLGFVRLQASERYLGADRPGGVRGFAWLGGMLVGTLVLATFLGWYAWTKGPVWMEQLGL